MKQEWLNLALVGGGGALGAIARYGVGGLLHRNPALAGFPFGTLTVNLLGCLLIGLGAGLADARQNFTPEARLFVFVGAAGRIHHVLVVRLRDDRAAARPRIRARRAQCRAQRVRGAGAGLAGLRADVP